MNTAYAPTEKVTRVRCIACKRLFGDDVWAIADAGCPACGTVWVATPGEMFSKRGWPETVSVKGTRHPATVCSIACETATSLTCKCSCGGSAHGLRA